MKVLHCNLNGWERRAIASQDYLALAGELGWRQHSRPRLHHRLTLRSPSGALGMGVATQVTRRVVVTTPLMVTLSLASEPEPPHLPGTLTSTSILSYGVDQGKHAVEEIRRLEHRMDDFAHVQTEMQASIDSQINMMHDLFSHFEINPDA
jgi:hypothetical protein